MTKVLTFKTKASARDIESIKLRWWCELMGLAVIQDFGLGWAREQFQVRFGAPPDETVYSAPTQPSAAVRFWGMEQHAIALAKGGDHEESERLLGLIADAASDKDGRGVSDALSDLDWNWCCSRPIPVKCEMPAEYRKAQA
jgi:hypothetical protein